ncbi:MAG: ATP-dependent DNA helicase RecG [Clostridia bacterium]|nr:ATP-dependent DNA helicase RecG [Clostridia bacterium]
MVQSFSLYDSVEKLSGVGKARAEKLERLGITTVKDLVYFFPRAYEARGNVRLLSQFNEEISQSYVLTVATEVRSANVKRGFTISKFRAFDSSGSVEIVFFNSPFVKDIFHTGLEFRFYGKTSVSKGRLQLVNPKYEPIIEDVPLEDYVPVYPSTQGLSSKQLDKLIKSTLNIVLPRIIDPIPEKIRLKNSLCTLSYAIKNAHSPKDEDSLRRALTRLSFDEMLIFGISISLSASQKKHCDGIRFSPCSIDPLTALLPYELTPSQKRAINDIYSDTVIGKSGVVAPMARIIVGDVGCGKTVCAITAMYIAVKSGYQAALMVPTEILARQHYQDVKELLSPLGIRVELLLGSTSQKEKKRIYEQINSGDTNIVIGTHALISDKLNFNNLGLVITDEQHRFGVNQRAKLKKKSENAHLLVMSATPIPRTLALAIYGDLDVSRIVDMPKGRTRVETYVVDESYRKRLNDFISKQVSLGGQCYIVCPSIESDEEYDEIMVTDKINAGLVNTGTLNLKNAVDFSEELKKALPHLRISVLHGKMKPAEKDAIMGEFSSGNIDVLVSTTVIEVGVNVPNASLMIVENSERFGLSQLHQLRGRVGRGMRKSYCVLVSDAAGEKSSARLDIMKSTYDGFEIAEKDLILRGPGDFFSANNTNNIRQSGGFEFKFATKCDDHKLFELAFSTAKAVVEDDPGLCKEENKLLREQIEEHVYINLDNLS